MSEGDFLVKLEADSRFHFGLEMFDVSLEGEFILEREGTYCLAQLFCRGPDIAALSEHQLFAFG